jgi:predicted RNase H-like nuclease (RuvC/YqgF family)
MSDRESRQTITEYASAISDLESQLAEARAEIERLRNELAAVRRNTCGLVGMLDAVTTKKP